MPAIEICDEQADEFFTMTMLSVCRVGVCGVGGVWLGVVGWCVCMGAGWAGLAVLGFEIFCKTEVWILIFFSKLWSRF